VIDVLILTKTEDGTVEATELSDIDELGELRPSWRGCWPKDVEHLAAAMEPGSTAGVLIWENLWAAPFAAAARRSGGQLIANGRIPIGAGIQPASDVSWSLGEHSYRIARSATVETWQ
jgi:hypothetical protein